mgnify:FL=1|tara:strand:- start:1189 stop:1662 length:474 start_codon:yes stop_codon:yes gene_type:complete
MKTKLEKSLEQIFDMPEDSPSIAQSKDLEISEASSPVVVHDTDQTKDIDSDYMYARENLYSIIENGSAALNALVNVANASESPRAYEVVSHLMKTLTDANKDLLEIQGKVKKLKEETPNNQNASVTNNSLFIGSTMELQQLLLDPTNTNQPKDITEK